MPFCQLFMLKECLFFYALSSGVLWKMRCTVYFIFASRGQNGGRLGEQAALAGLSRSVCPSSFIIVY